MEYNASFIDNLYWQYNNINFSVKNGIGQTVQRTLLKRYEISPGLVAKRNGVFYNVLDRNLRESCEYYPDVEILVNENKLSYSKIALVKNGLTNYGAEKVNISSYWNMPYVYELESEGYIYDILKLPLDTPCAEKDKWATSDTCTYTNFGEKFVEQLDPDPYMDDESYNKYVETVDNYVIDHQFTNVILVGVSTILKNPYNFNGNANATILRAWSTWKNLFRNIPNIRLRPSFYVHANVETFRKFIHVILYPNSEWAQTIAQEFTDDEKKMLSKFVLLTLDRVKITDDGVTLDDEKLYVTYDGIGHQVKNIATENDNNFYTYSSRKTMRLLMSNVGDINAIGTGGNSNAEVIYSSKKIICNLNSVKSYISELDFGNCYSVAVKADKIRSDVISVFDINKKYVYTYRKAAKDGQVSVSFFELKAASSINDLDSERIDTALDNAVKTGNYITPNEYYSNVISAASIVDGNDGYKKVGNEEDDDVPKWFWSNTLKNWCIFKQHTLRNTFKLYVWNGKNGWDCFEDIILNPQSYQYNISKLKFGIEFSTTYKYNNIPIQYKVVVLNYDSIFSQYDGYSFQTLRIGKIWSDNISACNRYPISIGIPTVMRLASGEIGLIYSLTVCGVDTSHPLIYPENVKFLNAVSRQFFGAGDEKTIIDDWKRIEKISTTTDTASAITSMNETSLVNADEINTVKDNTAAVSMVFEPFKQYIETDNIDTDAYVERWN